MDDAAAVLHALHHTELPVRALQTLAQLLPTLDLPFAPAWVLVQRNAELVQQVRSVALDEPRHVLAEVLARLGHEVTEALEHFVSHGIREALEPAVAALLVTAHRGGHHLRAFSDRGIEVHHAVLRSFLEPQVERHVIDAGAGVIN